MRVFFLLVCVLALPFQKLLAEQHDSVSVGVILPLSGDFARFGELVKKGIGQADSTGVRLIFEDEACVPKTTLSSFSKLANIDKVKFILGPTCGSPQKVLAPHLKRKHILGMITSSASEELFALSGGNFFGVQYSIENESRFNAQVFNEKGLKRATLVYFDNDFSRAHEKAFREAFRGEVIETFRYNSTDAGTIRSIATKIKQLQPDSLYLPDATPMLNGLVTELRKLGVKNLYLHSVYSAQMQGVLEVEGHSVDGLVYSYPDISDKDAIAYFPKLAADILFEAIRSCGNDTSCVSSKLKQKNNFDSKQMIRSNIALKTIQNGKFTKLS